MLVMSYIDVGDLLMGTRELSPTIVTSIIVAELPLGKLPVKEPVLYLILFFNECLNIFM